MGHGSICDMLLPTMRRMAKFLILGNTNVIRISAYAQWVGFDETQGGKKMEEGNTCRFYANVPFKPAARSIAASVSGKPPLKWSDMELEVEMQAR